MNFHRGKPNATHRTTLVVIVALLLGWIAPTMAQETNWYAQVSAGWVYEVRVLIKPISRMLLILATAWIFFEIRPGGLVSALGLATREGRLLKGVGLGVLWSLPLLILGMLSGVRDDLNFRSLPYNSLGPGVFEELFFRAFGFGFLVRFANWRLLPAAVLTGIVFSLSHIHLQFVQDMGVGMQLVWLAMLAGAGVFYAWLYARWGFNLWLIMTMHTILDLCWELFMMSANPFGMPGIIGAMTLVFAVPSIMTSRQTRRIKIQKTGDASSD